MIKTAIAKGLSTAVVATVGLCGLASPGHAAVFVGSFDPAFGGTVFPLANMGFRGTASFYVPDACLSLGNDFFSNSSFCTSGDPIKMLSAIVELYDSNAPAVQPTLDTVSFATYDMMSGFDSVLIVNGAVVGVDSVIIPAPVDAQVPGFYEGPIGLSFFQSCVYGDVDYCAIEEGISFVHTPATDSRSGANIWVCDPVAIGCALGTSSVTAPMSFVPEPSGLALLLLSLVSAGAASRRRGSPQT